jgi:hypothetical protein
MTDRQCDVALWFSAVSAWPEVVEQRVVDVWALPFEIVQTVMRERGEPYVFKAAVSFGGWVVRRYWHVRLPGTVEVVTLPVSVGEVVKVVWVLCEADGIDPVEVSSRDALGLVRAGASCEPGGVLAGWCQAAEGAGMPEVRLFMDGWNGRRAAEVRSRLLLGGDRERLETRRQ